MNRARAGILVAVSLLGVGSLAIGQATTVASVAALRSGSFGSATQLYLLAYYAGGVSDGAGVLNLNSTETAPDNGVTTFVDSTGKHWDRAVVPYPLPVALAGATTAGATASNTTYISAWISAGVLQGTTITGCPSGGCGSTGAYTVSISQTFGSSTTPLGIVGTLNGAASTFIGYISGTTLQVTSVIAGTIPNGANGPIQQNSVLTSESVLNVTSASSNPITPNSNVTGNGILPGTMITSQISGTTGGVGTYHLAIGYAKNLGSSTAPIAMTVGLSVASAQFIGSISGVINGTVITGCPAGGCGITGNYTINNAQSIGSSSAYLLFTAYSSAGAEITFMGYSSGTTLYVESTPTSTLTVNDLITTKGLTLTVTSVTQGQIALGTVVAGTLSYNARIAGSTAILSQTSGTTGGTGTYVVNMSQSLIGLNSSQVVMTTFAPFGRNLAICTASSSSVTLSAAGTFLPQQPIALYGCGATQTAGTTSSLTVTPHCVIAECSSTYYYTVVALDGNGGYSAAPTSASTSSGSAVLGRNADSTWGYNTITWKPSSTAAAYAIYGRISGSLSLIAITSGGTQDLPCNNTNGCFYTDYGLSVPSYPVNLPVYPPASAQNDLLLTTVASVASSTSLTINSPLPSTTNNAAPVNTDNTAALQAALRTGQSLGFEAGIYPFTSGLNLSSNGQNLFGSGEYGTTLMPSGNFNAISSLNTAGVGARDLAIDASNLGLGDAITLNNTQRDDWERIACDYCQQFATVQYGLKHTFKSDLYLDVQGQYAIRAIGDSVPTISLEITDLIGGHLNKMGEGLLLDGMIDGIDVRNFQPETARHGVWSTNIHGTGEIEYAKFLEFGGEYSAKDEVELDQGLDIYFLAGEMDASEGTNVFVGQNVSVVNLTNNRMSSAAQYNADIYGKQVTMTGNQMWDPNSCLPIGGCPTSGTSYNNLQIEPTAADVTVTNNILGSQLYNPSSNEPYALGIGDGARSVTFSGNDIEKYVTAPWKASPAPTVIIRNNTIYGVANAPDLVPSLAYLPGYQFSIPPTSVSSVTNMLSWSEDMNQSPWINSNHTYLTISPNRTSPVAPDLTKTAQLISNTSSSSWEDVRQVATIASSTNRYLFSLFVYPTPTSASYVYCWLLLTGGTQVTGAVNFNAQTGAVISSAGLVGDASVTGSISGTTLNVTNLASGQLGIGATLTGTGIAPGTIITAQISGFPGEAGTYLVNTSQAVSSEAITTVFTASTIPLANGWYLVWGVTPDNSSGNTSATFQCGIPPGGDSLTAWASQLTNLNTSDLTYAAPFLYVPTFGAAASLTSGHWVTTVAGLPPSTGLAAAKGCNSNSAGVDFDVSDASSPTWNSAPTGGGTSYVKTQCNGTSFVAY